MTFLLVVASAQGIQAKQDWGLYQMNYLCLIDYWLMAKRRARSEPWATPPPIFLTTRHEP